jgi:hypothetical protein
MFAPPAAHVSAPPQMHSPPGAAPGGIGAMLRMLAARHAAPPHAAGPGVRQAGAPFPLTQRGNPVSPYGHEPAVGPVPNAPMKPGFHLWDGGVI